jgi:hypothetical protein
MSVLIAQAFVANAISTVVFDRPITETEFLTLKAIKQNAIDAGEQVSPGTTTTDDAGIITRVSYFSNIATANAYSAANLAFVPAPISSTVEEV